MTEDEKLLNELPFQIQRHVIELCPCCQKHDIERTVNYELKTEIVPTAIGHRFRIYYKSNNYGLYDSTKYIGRNTGLGCKSIKEAIEELKGYLKNEEF